MGNGGSVLIRRPLWDWLLARIAIGLLWIYKRCISRFTGRTCLFHPSCSMRSLTLFRQRGFVEGLSGTRAQLFDCYPEYSLSFGDGGRIRLVTRSGRTFSEEEIAPSVLAHLPRPPTGGT